MFSKAFITVLLAVSAIASPIVQVPANGLDLVADLNTIDAATKNIGSLVDAFKGDAGDVIKIQQASEALQGSIKKATANLKADSHAYTAADVTKIKPVFDYFVPDTQSTLSKLSAKKATFDKLSTTSVVLQQLQAQKSLGTALNNLILSKSPAEGKALDAEKWGAINSALDKAIATFSS
jgi:hypothetical protein